MSKLQEIYDEARQYFIGGASAGGRFNSTLQQPLYLKSASGSRIIDADGKAYIIPDRARHFSDITIQD